jgi:hypothetical protein
VEKLLWASIAWLLSAAHGGMPVGELVTHDHTKRVFLDLAMECLELACTDPDLHWQADGPSPADLLRRNQDSVLQGLVDYSLAIHAAVPSVAMAQRELHYRNGYFLRRLAAVRRGGDASCLRSFAESTLHETWLHKAGVHCGRSSCSCCNVSNETELYGLRNQSATKQRVHAFTCFQVGSAVPVVS